jgi:hypothetical protein
VLPGICSIVWPFVGCRAYVEQPTRGDTGLSGTSAWRDVANVDEMGRAARRWGPMGDHVFAVFEIMLLRVFGLGRRTAQSVMASGLGAWSGAGALFSWLARRV